MASWSYALSLIRIFCAAMADISLVGPVSRENGACPLMKLGAAPRSYVLAVVLLAAPEQRKGGPEARPLGRYSMISATTPEPTVLPPSRMANLSPLSMAIGWIS